MCVRVLRERGDQLTIGSISYYTSCRSVIAINLFEAIHGREYKTYRIRVTEAKH